MNKNKKGFTLIELLVVIAIIGLLSTLSVLALNSARARARDAKRIADVKQIQTALEMYYNDVGDYPESASVTAGATLSSDNGTYLRAIPVPPLPTDGDSCEDDADEYTYAKTGDSGADSSYSIEFCLGATINEVTGNEMRYATPAGIY
jgi:type II secretion system protein G